ncbi:hypothetical protein KI387_030411, partial [Taxus chinensis]
MGDPGVISGLIGMGINIAVTDIISRINIAVRCTKELGNLKDLVMEIEPVNRAMQQYRLALNSTIPIGVLGIHENPVPSSVNDWLKKLNSLLQEAGEMVLQCTIPKYNMLSRYKTSKTITRIIARIRRHLENAALIGITNQLCQTLMVRDVIGQRNNEIGGASREYGSGCRNQRIEMIQEPLVVGQEKAFLTLWKLLVNGEGHRYGVVGMGGSGNTLLLKRVYNSKEVRDHFGDGIVAWLTVLQNPSIETLRSELATQVALQTGASFNHKEEDAQLWLQDKLKERKFALFLDDVWEGEGSSRLLESMGMPQRGESKIVVSCRDNKLLLQMGVPPTSTVSMENLLQSESWDLFSSHAFLHNYGNPPVNIVETARRVFAECGGLPLAIKVVGAAMAGITEPTEWELTLQRLQN